MNIIEHLREKSVSNLFLMNNFKASFNTWKIKINQILGRSPDFFKYLNVGDVLEQIFKTTGASGRSQSSVSAGGSSWEGLVCWYLNLCLVGSRTVVIKHSKKLIPPCIADAITVNYGTFISNTESDLIAITFPNRPEFVSDIDVSNINYVDALNTLCKQYFQELQVGIIQCKTNWNDNAQIPMLWQIVYSSNGFENSNITIGRNGFSMKNLKRFFYAFITVPSQKGGYKANGLPIKRVANLSGGNYWGKPSVSGIAHSLKEIFNKNFNSGWIHATHQKDVELFIENNNISYFNLSL